MLSCLRSGLCHDTADITSFNVAINVAHTRRRSGPAQTIHQASRTIPSKPWTSTFPETLKKKKSTMPIPISALHLSSQHLKRVASSIPVPQHSEPQSLEPQGITNPPPRWLPSSEQPQSRHQAAGIFPLAACRKERRRYIAKL
jgi:hypothetical protein